MNSSKKIILTGATGLIGKEVLPLLKKEGFEDPCFIIKDLQLI